MHRLDVDVGRRPDIDGLKHFFTPREPLGGGEIGDCDRSADARERASPGKEGGNVKHPSSSREVDFEIRSDLEPVRVGKVTGQSHRIEPDEEGRQVQQPCL
ncbi:MAG: hypothetical protein L0271_27085, partial [Gemmatimonadetes bacterium]|nr:hypothetical protein [Gemmatimonadota bacterium]